MGKILSIVIVAVVAGFLLGRWSGGALSESSGFLSSNQRRNQQPLQDVGLSEVLSENSADSKFIVRREEYDLIDGREYYTNRMDREYDEVPPDYRHLFDVE